MIARGAYEQEKLRSEIGMASIIVSVAAKMVAGCKSIPEAAALLESEAVHLARAAGYPTLANPLAGDCEYLSWFPSVGEQEFNSWQEAA